MGRIQNRQPLPPVSQSHRIRPRRQPQPPVSFAAGHTPSATSASVVTASGCANAVLRKCRKDRCRKRLQNRPLHPLPAIAGNRVVGLYPGSTGFARTLNIANSNASDPVNPSLAILRAV